MVRQDTESICRSEIRRQVYTEISIRRSWVAVDTFVGNRGNSQTRESSLHAKQCWASYFQK